MKIEKRITGIEVYVFRWRQPVENGKSLQRKIILGTVKELTKTQAQKKPTYSGRKLIPCGQ